MAPYLQVFADNLLSLERTQVLMCVTIMFSTFSSSKKERKTIFVFCSSFPEDK